MLVLYTADIVACRAFYEELGLRFTSERHGSGPEHAAADLTGGVVLEIYPAASETPAGRLRLGLTLPAGQVGQRHLAGGRHVLRDPDGRVVEVIVP
jgi:catechol 2,3-dioxygenase-like lactoylglutathione lyase family enzyme